MKRCTSGPKEPLSRGQTLRGLTVPHAYASQTKTGSGGSARIADLDCTRWDGLPVLRAAGPRGTPIAPRRARFWPTFQNRRADEAHGGGAYSSRLSAHPDNGVRRLSSCRPSRDRVVLSWDSLVPGTQYYVQTSTNLLTWTAATNTTATNVSLTFTGGKARMFRLSASNAPPQSAMLAWDPSVPSTDVTGYSICYGVSTGSYTDIVDIGPGTNGVVSNLLAGTTYYFATTAHTSSGLESNYSNEAVWQCPLRLRIQRLP